MSAVAPTDRSPAESGAAASFSLAAVAWILLHVAGQVASFRLTMLVPWAAYPHLVDWPELLHSRRVELVVLVIQTIAVAVALVRGHLLIVVRRFIEWLGVGGLVLLVGLVGLSLAVPTKSVQRFVTEAMLAGWIVAVSLGNFIVIGRVVTGGWLDRASAWVGARLTMPGQGGESRRWDHAFPWVVAASVLVVSAALAWFVLEGVPHIDDSIAYLFQAKTFALGRISVAPPPDSASFMVPHIVLTDQAWFAKYFPGWPALLSLGVLARAAWLVNPVLAAATVLMVHALLRRLYDRGSANAATLLVAVSPWLITSSSEMMSHPAALFCGVLALLGIERQRDTRAGPWALVAGVALGLLYLVRPPDAAALGLVAALWAWGLWGRRLSLGSLATVAVVAIAVAAISLPYNAALTGDPLLPPHRLWSDTNFGPNADVFGFGRDIGIPLWRDHDPLPGHGPVDVALNANKNVFLLSSELFGWAAGSLWLLVPGIVLLRHRRRPDGLMIAIVGAVALIHAAYWYPGGPDFGPRYWYLMIVPLAVFTAHGARTLGDHLAERTGSRFGGRHVAAVMTVASLTALLAGVPWRAAVKYHRYREVGADLRGLANGAEWRNALVFVEATDRTDYQSAFNFNTPTLDGPHPVFALDAGAEHRRAVLRRYPDRPVWIVGRPADGSSRLVVLGGPYPPGQDPPRAAASPGGVDSERGKTVGVTDAPPRQ